MRKRVVDNKIPCASAILNLEPSLESLFNSHPSLLLASIFNDAAEPHVDGDLDNQSVRPSREDLKMNLNSNSVKHIPPLDRHLPALCSAASPAAA